VPVNIAGYAETLKAMQVFDEDLYKGMDKQIKGVMIPIRDKARNYAPANNQLLRNWTSPDASEDTVNYRAFPKYDQSETKRGIVYRPGNNKRNKGTAFNVSHYVANRSAGGAIYETSGRKTPGGNRFTESLNPNAGQQFMAQFASDSLVGKNRPLQGRLIYRAWSEDQGRAAHAINLAIGTAVKIFNATNTPGSFGLAA
jgi:stress-induced morphogen